MTHEGSLGNHGGSQEKYAKAWENAPETLPLTDPRVQVLLAQGASMSGNAMEEWLEPGADGNSMSARYRAYIESPACIKKEIHIHDAAEVKELLDEVQAFSMPIPPSTLH